MLYLRSRVSPPRRPRLPAPLQRAGRFARNVVSGAFRPRSRTIIVLAIIGVPAAVVWVVAQNFTTALWFDEVGHGDVFTRVLFAKTLLAVLAGALTGLFLVVNAWSAISLAPARVATRAYPLRCGGMRAGRRVRRLEREGELAVFPALGASAALRRRGSAPSPRYRLLRLLAALPPEAFEPAHPDRRAGLGGGDRHPHPYRRGHTGGRSGPLTPRASISRCSGAFPCSCSLGACTWRPSRLSWGRHTQERASHFPGPHYVDVHVRLLGCAFSPTWR